MSGTNTPYSLKANGNINPCVFITIDVGTDNAALQCTATTGANQPIGISGQGAESPPIDGAATYHATAGNPVNEWYGPGAECLLTLGTGGCTRLDLLKPDASGQGVTSSVDGDFYGARALESGAAGEKVHVVVICGFRGA